MENEEEKLRLALLEEFGSAKERWTDTRLELGRRANDMQIGVSERIFQLILALVSISVVFLTIVIPVAYSQTSTPLSLLIVPTIFSFLATIVGIAQLFMTTWWDRKCIADDGEWGVESYGRYHHAANNIYADLYMGSIPKEKIEAYGKLFEQIPKESQERSEERNKSWQNRTINFLFWSFLGIFFTRVSLASCCRFASVSQIRPDSLCNTPWIETEFWSGGRNIPTPICDSLTRTVITSQRVVAY